MATVYLPNDIRQERPVVLKVLRSDVAAPPGAERFLPEIRMAGNLNHRRTSPR